MADFGEGSTDFGEGSTDFGEGSTDFGEGSTDFGEGSTDFGEGSTDFGEGSIGRRSPPCSLPNMQEAPPSQAGLLGCQRPKPLSMGCKHSHLSGRGHFPELAFRGLIRGGGTVSATATESGADALVVVCPSCDYNFPLADGLAPQARELLLAVEQDKLNAQWEEMRLSLAQQLEQLEDEREQIKMSLAVEQDQLNAEREEMRLSLAHQVEQLEAEREQSREELRHELHEEVQVQLKDLKASAEEKTRKLSEAQEMELALRKANRELRQQVDDQNLAQQRERDELDAQLREEYEQANAVRLKEKEDHIERLGAQIAELKRKADSQSRLAEGVPNQEVFADLLRHQFPHDDIQVVRRGQAGADVIQVVYSPSGQRWGTIRWECKRAANWQGEWVDKVTKDAGDDVGVLVSEVLPAGMKDCGQVGTVWVCNYVAARALAMALRHGLVQVAGYRAANALRQDAEGKVFDYIATGGFAPRVLELCRAIVHMQEQLRKERMAATRLWHSAKGN